MEIRGDLKEVSGLISRMISIGREFSSKDSTWSHLRNKEDFEKVYRIPDFEKRTKMERIYADGRDMALFMSDALQAINRDFSKYPTLTKIIDSFQNTWVYEDLAPILNEAKKAAEDLNFNNWAFSQMLYTFEEQAELLKAVAETLAGLKRSDLYKQENGEEVTKQTTSIHFGDVTGSNISLNSQNVNQSIKSKNEVFNEIIEAIEASDIPNKEELIAATNDMATEAESGSITNSYKKFIALAADHMTVFAPFLPALANLL